MFSSSYVPAFRSFFSCMRSDPEMCASTLEKPSFVSFDRNSSTVRQLGASSNARSPCPSCGVLLIILDRAEPLRQKLCYLFRRPKILLPGIPRASAMHPHAAPFVGPFDVKKRLLRGIVVHHCSSKAVIEPFLARVPVKPVGERRGALRGVLMSGKRECLLWVES